MFFELATRGAAAALIMLSAAAAAAAAVAEQAVTTQTSAVDEPAVADEWLPPTPAPALPKTFDWIQLTSDEWLKGEFTVMYEDEVEFDSSELDLQTFDLEDVRQLRTADVVQVALVNKEVLVGRLLIDGDAVVVVTDQQERRLRRKDVLSIAQGAPKEINYWSGKVTLGLNVRSGNSELVEFNGSAGFQRRTTKNRILLDYLGNYNLADSVASANNHRASANWDKFMTPRLFFKPVFFEWFKDPFQNISHRETVGFGAGYELMNTPKVDWRLSGGPGYQQTTFVSVTENESSVEETPALTFGSNLDYELNKRIDFVWEYRLQIVNKISGRYNHHFVAGFETDLTKRLDFDIQMIWDRVQDPREIEDGSVPEQDDYRLVIGLGFDW